MPPDAVLKEPGHVPAYQGYLLLSLGRLYLRIRRWIDEWVAVSHSSRSLGHRYGRDTLFTTKVWAKRCKFIENQLIWASNGLPSQACTIGSVCHFEVTNIDAQYDSKRLVMEQALPVDHLLEAGAAR